MEKTELLIAIIGLWVFVLCNADINTLAVVFLDNALSGDALPLDFFIVLINCRDFLALKLAGIRIPVYDLIPAYNLQQPPQFKAG